MAYLSPFHTSKFSLASFHLPIFPCSCGKGTRTLVKEKIAKFPFPHELIPSCSPNCSPLPFRNLGLYYLVKLDKLKQSIIYAILMSCAKAMQTNFDDFRVLFSRNFGKIRIDSKRNSVDENEISRIFELAKNTCEGYTVKLCRFS